MLGGAISNDKNKFYGSLNEVSNDNNSKPIQIFTPKKQNYTQNKYTFSFLVHDVPVIANVSSAILGVSIFAMPWGFLQSGLIGGTLITLFVAYLSFETARILLYSQHSIYQKTGNVKSYAEIAADTLGGVSWGHLVKTATIISCLGSCVGYLIFLGEICGQLFNVSFDLAVLCAVVPLTCLSWIRSFRELTVFTTIGVVSVIATVVYVVYDGQYEHTSITPQSSAPLFIPTTFLNFVGPATFLFTSHYCVLSMGAEALLEQDLFRHLYRGRSDFITAVDMNSGSSFGTEIVHNNGNGSNGSGYGSANRMETDNDTINNLTYQSASDSEQNNEPDCESKDECITGFNGLPMSPHEYFDEGFHLGNTIDSENQNLLSHHELYSAPHNSGGMSTKEHTMEDIISNSNIKEVYIDIEMPVIHPIPLPATAALSIESLNRPVGVAYAMSAVLIVLHGSTGFALYRSVDFVMDASGDVEPGCEGRVCQNIILNLSAGVVRDLIGVTLCVAIVVSYVLLLAPAREHIESSVIKRLGLCSEHSYTVLRNVIRMVLVLLTAAVAICMPYFGTLLGQVGGLTDALQAFVLPPLIYLSIHSHQLSTLQLWLYSLVCAWGVCTIAYTSYNLFCSVL